MMVAGSRPPTRLDDGSPEGVVGSSRGRMIRKAFGVLRGLVDGPRPTARRGSALPDLRNLTIGVGDRDRGSPGMHHVRRLPRSPEARASVSSRMSRAPTEPPAPTAGPRAPQCRGTDSRTSDPGHKKGPPRPLARRPFLTELV